MAIKGTEFGLQVKSKLISKGLQQQDLAKSLNMSTAYLSDLLLGKANGKKAKTHLSRIAMLLEIKE